MIAPMLASIGEAPLADANLVYEPKYDGIRAIVEIGRAGRGVRLWSRLGNDKTSQFPEIADALAAWAKRRREPLVIDGEIVALDAHGEPAGFQHLQGRIHLKESTSPRGVRRTQVNRRAARLADAHSDVSRADTQIAGAAAPTNDGQRGGVAFIAFDLLRTGPDDLCDRPLIERRRALERLFKAKTSAVVRLSEQVRGDGRALYGEALARGWEGLIAKQAQSKYRPGKRTPDWVKLKIVHEQEFVIGGWTEPRQSRVYFGALLLGVYDGERLVYVGHTGTGFDTKELARVMARLKPLETRETPFLSKPKTNERPHWVEPKLVAQIKFTEWTSDGKLRHPVYLGLRDDKHARDVVREDRSRLHETSRGRLESRQPQPAPAARPPIERAGALIEQLRDMEAARQDGTIDLGEGRQLAVTNLHKVFWPALKATKGDLLRYYVEVAPYILPVLADRPLVMKRFPNGVEGKPFYQHRVQDTPPGVRVETIPDTDGRPQLVGGDLLTLLYTCQLGAISQDPWFSRVRSVHHADHVAIDLDPAESVPFEQVLDVARWVRDELARLGVASFPKTSGASGLHIYVPLAPRTPYEAGLLFCQLVATMVAEKHPKTATVERSVRKRGARVYVDYLQNIEGKTLASAYSARASGYAGVSTPLAWEEVDAGVRREDFTIRTVPARLRSVGDLWAGVREAPGADLHEIVRRSQRPRRR
ncbi:MAG: DNA ligase D [Vicinamibacterales bacterium]